MTNKLVRNKLSERCENNEESACDCQNKLNFSCDQIDQKIEEMFASRKRVTDVATPLVIGVNNANATGQPMIAPNAVQMPSASNQQKLELAKRLASQINMAKNLGPEADNTQQVTAAIMRGDMSAPQISVRQQVIRVYLLT